MEEREAIKQRFELLAGELNERTRHRVAAAEALSLGWGGISAVSRATGVSRRAIRQGIKELQEPAGTSAGRIRRKNRYGCMTSPCLNWGERLPMASMT